MIYVLAVLAGMAGAVAGWFISGAIAVGIAGLFGMSDFEGARGMFGFLFVGPIGGLIAMVASAWIVLRLGSGRPPWGHTLPRLGLVLTAIALIVAGGIVLRLYTVDTYTNTLPPTLEFEVRLPASIPATDRDQVRVELHTDKNVAEGIVHRGSPAAVDGAQVVDGLVSLDFKTPARLLVVFVPDQPTRLFRLPLARDPDSSATLSAWAKPDHIDTADDQPRAAPPDDPVEIRYRVRHAGDQ